MRLIVHICDNMTSALRVFARESIRTCDYMPVMLQRFLPEELDDEYSTGLPHEICQRLLVAILHPAETQLLARKRRNDARMG